MTWIKRVNGRRLLRRVLAVAALLWAAFGLFLALWIVLPVLSWGIFLPILTWVISLLATEFSLLLAAYAVAGLGLAALCWRNGASRTAVVALAFGAATVALSLLPVAQAWQTARAEGVSLSLREYFSGPSVISDSSPDETRVYARPEGPEGEKLKLDVYEAGGRGTESAARSGAVIMVHGGAYVTGQRSSETARWDAWLADKGYVVFDIDYRLAPPPRWKDAPGDVKCAVGWVKENAESYGVDPDRIALMGNSAGGFLSLLAAYTEGYLRLPPSCETGDTSVAAWLGFYSQTDLPALCTDGDCESDNPVRTFTGATPATNPDRYRLVSPISHVDSSAPPDLPGAGRARLFHPSRTVPATRAEVGGGRRGAPAAGAALRPARLRPELGWVGLADHPAGARAIPGTTSGEAKPENAIVIDTGGQGPDPSAIEVPAMYKVLYLGAQDSPPVNYQSIRNLGRRVRRPRPSWWLALPAGGVRVVVRLFEVRAE